MEQDSNNFRVLRKQPNQQAATYNLKIVTIEIVITYPENKSERFFPYTARSRSLLVESMFIAKKVGRQLHSDRIFFFIQLVSYSLFAYFDFNQSNSKEGVEDSPT